MKEKIDPNDPSTWPDDYIQCDLCDFGSRGEKGMRKHLKDEHGKTVK